MKVYEIAFRSNDFQAVVANDPTVWKEAMRFDGSPKADNWKVPSFRVYNPNLKRGSFVGIGPGTVGIWSAFLEEFRSIFERSGEILPIEIDGEQAYCLNVLDVCSCLNYEESELVLSRKSGKVISVDRFVFREDLVPETPLFKIPETSRGKILTVDRGDEDEFLRFVDLNGFSGLRFDLLYDSAAKEGGVP